MGTTYEKAGSNVLDLVNEIMESYHPDLAAAGVTIDVLLAHADPESEEPAVKAHGYAAAAVVRKIGLKDRVKGCADAEIVIDGDQIDEWSDRELMALIDHELTHLEVARTKGGMVKRDDLDRPMLLIRLHDRQFGWFDEVARRWGDSSFEVQQAKDMVSDYDFAQLYLPGFNPSDIGKIKSEQLAESTAADQRNGETTSISSVTLSSAGKSVTLTGEQFKRAHRALSGAK